MLGSRGRWVGGRSRLRRRGWLGRKCRPRRDGRVALVVLGSELRVQRVLAVLRSRLIAVICRKIRLLHLLVVWET
jgi:hypothetical protein